MKSVGIEEEFALAAALKDEVCYLDHSGDPRGQTGPHMQATDWLMLPMPDGTTMSLPVCEVCARSLQEYEEKEKSDWYLLICTKCFATKWILKAECRAVYPEMIHFVRECPKCMEV